MTDNAQDLAETHREVLDQLAAGDVVHPIEELKAATATLIERLAELDAGEAGDPLDPARGELDRVATVALPLAEHGANGG